jgi:hypothetical protein
MWALCLGDYFKLTLSIVSGIIPRRVLELKFKGNRPMGRPRKRRFCQLLEDEMSEELVINRK